MCANISVFRRGLHIVLVALALVSLGIKHGGAQQSDRVAISVDDPRPVAGVVRALEQRYGWVITYEDPPYLHPSEVSDVTQAVRKYHYPNEPKLLIPRARSFTFNYSIPAGSSVPEQTSTLEALLKTHHASGNPGVFRVVRTGGVFHVVPALSRGLSGDLEQRHSILETKISLSSEERTAFGMLEAICDAIKRSTGVEVLIMTYPMNLLHQVRVHGGAEDEKARTVLLRTLASTNWKLSWQLLRGGAPADGYGLNIHVVRDQASRAP